MGSVYLYRLFSFTLYVSAYSTYQFFHTKILDLFLGIVMEGA